MTNTATGIFTITTWDPQTYDEADGAALGRVSVGKAFSGDLVGASAAELLTVHDADGNPAVYVAVERVTGALNGRSGTFVLHHTAPGTAGEPIVIRIVPNTGAGDLAGISGSLVITGDVEGGHTYSLSYDLAPADAN